MCFMQMIMKDVKIMTFDEAIEELRLAIPERFYSPTMHDIAVMLEVQTKVINLLREEYAPTVEMTKEQYEILVLSRNNAVNRVDKVGLLEFMSAYSLLNQEIDHLGLMQAWLHPETIKVVDE